MKRTKRSITSGLLLFFICAFCVSESTVAQTILIPRPIAESQEATIYTGEIHIPGMGILEITFSFIEDDKDLQVFMTIPAQGVKQAPLETTFGKNGIVIGTLKEADLTFTFNESEDGLRAAMKQGAFETTIALALTGLPSL